MSGITKDFFEKMNNELDKIYNMDENNYAAQEYSHELFCDWKNRLNTKIEGAYLIKAKRIDVLDYNSYPILKTILRDMYFKHNTKKKKSKKNIEIEKLLKAREENLDFDLELAKMITGDNGHFPYRSSKLLTSFFQNLGYNFICYEEKDWVKNRLEELNITEIHTLLSNGLFKKKYYINYINGLNEIPLSNDNDIDIDSYFNEAKKEFEIFIKNSMKANESFDLSMVLDMNVNIELLFDNIADTKDKELNKLIEDAKERFISNDKQIGLEKLWDAYERLKTYFSNVNGDIGHKKQQKDKKASSEKLVDIISKDFDEIFINDEFKALTNIGNNYRIRHHEVGKKEMTHTHINYFFFRMLTLIDLCLTFLNKEK